MSLLVDQGVFMLIDMESFVAHGIIRDGFPQLLDSRE